MARPRKENADYFSHDTNMRSHRKVIALRNKHGIEGYAIYVMLLEHIGSCDFFIAKWNEVEQEMIAGDFGVSVEKLVDIVSFCDRLNLLQVVEGNLQCSALVERLQDMIEKRNRERGKVVNRERTPGGAFIGKENTTSGGVSVTEMPQSKVKEIKVKEKKEKEIKIYSEEQIQIIENFIDTENTQIKYQMTKNENYINSQAAELDKLLKDGYSLETIQTVLAFVKQDSFRSKQILSVRKLREKDKNGIPYIVRMLDEIKKWRPKVLDLDQYNYGNQRVQTDS